MESRNLWVLLVGLVVVMVGYGIAMPVLPFFIEAMGGRGIHFGALIASYGIAQLLFAPLWGSLSDCYGRRPFLLLGLVGLGSAMLLFSWATHLWMLYAAQVLSGVLSSAMLPAAQAYAADRTGEEERAAAMGRIGGAIGLGIILGPGLGGMLATASLVTPFRVAAGLAAVTFLLVLLVLPESLSPEQRLGSARVREILPDFSRMRGTLAGPASLGLVVAFIAIFSQTVFSSVYGLYAIARFDSDPGQIGTLLTGMAAMYALAQGLLVGPLTRRLGEHRLIVLAMAGSAVGFGLVLLSTSFAAIFASMGGLILCNALLKPSALALVSRGARAAQGQTMGMAESGMSLGRILGPLWGGLAFDIHLTLPFLSGILVLLSAMVFTLTRDVGLHPRPNVQGASNPR